MFKKVDRIATPRCDHCGTPLERFDGDTYCPDCVTYTVAADLIDLARADDTDLIDLARDDV
jgi:uncharacterized Zn finger protein (UPF0148 family)